MNTSVADRSKLEQADAIVAEPLETLGEVDFRFIELMFFAYRQFTADADAILASYGFGRAHHRILHFVNRSPGITIAELLDLLKITKQSLSRVLRQLIDEGFVAQLPGEEDRRQRRLYPTPKGRELTLELSRQQAKRLDAAIAKIGPDGVGAVAHFLAHLGGSETPARNWLESRVWNEGPIE